MFDKISLIYLFLSLARSINDFIPSSTTLTKLTAAELSPVYHSVHHGHSYVSQLWSVDLLKKIFNESDIRQNISCGKPKARDVAVNVLGITDIDQITFDLIEKYTFILNFEINHDKLFEEMINLQSTFKEVNSYREPLSIQGEKYIADHDVKKQIINEEIREPDDEERFLHKSSTQNHQDNNNHNRIWPEQLWAYLISKTTTNCEQMTKLISYVYSIPCLNAFTEDVFSHMKHAWTCSRNAMSIETIAAELQIRLNCKVKCNEFFTFVQNQPELIKCARRLEKYSN
ncbi:unnamed protein product [Rotaria sp. Silwood1]|nr:unnamed protein product [Rotaria sp. Silwood1]CAF4949202.1 unnamed protein product [Rotaria sp. Silwood1]